MLRPLLAKFDEGSRGTFLPSELIWRSLNAELPDTGNVPPAMNPSIEFLHGIEQLVNGELGGVETLARAASQMTFEELQSRKGVLRGLDAKKGKGLRTSDVLLHSLRVKTNEVGQSA
jgi:hypothetical protein